MTWSAPNKRLNGFYISGGGDITTPTPTTPIAYQWGSGTKTALCVFSAGLAPRIRSAPERKNLGFHLWATIQHDWKLHWPISRADARCTRIAAIDSVLAWWWRTFAAKNRGKTLIWQLSLDLLIYLISLFQFLSHPETETGLVQSCDTSDVTLRGGVKSSVPQADVPFRFKLEQDALTIWRWKQACDNCARCLLGPTCVMDLAKLSVTQRYWWKEMSLSRR